MNTNFLQGGRMAWINPVESETARKAMNFHQQLARTVWKSGSGLSEIQRHMIFTLVSSVNGCQH